MENAWFVTVLVKVFVSVMCWCNEHFFDLHLKKPDCELFLLCGVVGSVGTLAFTKMSRRDLGRRKETSGGSGNVFCNDGDDCSVWRCFWIMFGSCEVALLYVIEKIGLFTLLRLRYVRSSDRGFSWARVMASSIVLGL